MPLGELGEYLSSITDPESGASMEETPNRRLSERFDLKVPAMITQITGENHFYSQLCLTKDISSEGAYIGVTDPIPDDDTINVQLLYLIENDADRIEYVQMIAVGTVIRREYNGLAVRFTGEPTLKHFDMT